MRSRREAQGGTEITARVEALEDTAARVEEFEERLDFTERILVRSRDQAPLPESDRSMSTGGIIPFLAVVGGGR